MPLANNPVLQRELLVNLRMTRAFVLLAVYVVLLGLVVYVAWPQAQQIDVSNPAAARRLVDLFFLSQYVLAALLAPSFAAGAVSGEKERHTYEMLLASPLTPSAILAGKLLASLAHLALLVVASLPIAFLCLPLGGTSLYEVLAVYFALLLAMFLFGLIGLAASCHFRRTFAALLVSYLVILPLAVLGPLVWQALGQAAGGTRLVLVGTVFPLAVALVALPLWMHLHRRLLYPPDLGSEGQEVLDDQQELRQAVGMVIQRGRFPDMLFAPAQRIDLLADGANPVLDKEMGSEIFGQGTLMLRLVIQASTLLEFPAMMAFIFVVPRWMPWYICYVLLFNLLVSPVFSAGSITSERERETLDLLLCTVLSPWQILWPKLVAGLRVSGVLTLFLLWPVLLGTLMVSQFWTNVPAILAYVLIILGACLTTTNFALAVAVVFRRTATCLLTAYVGLLVLFALPPAIEFFASTFLPPGPARAASYWSQLTSPFAMAFAVPLRIDDGAGGLSVRPGDMRLLTAHAAWVVLLNSLLVVGMRWLFNARWRVAQAGA